MKPGTLSFTTAAQAFRFTVLPVIQAATDQTDQPIAAQYADTLLYWLEACANGAPGTRSAQDNPSVKGGE